MNKAIRKTLPLLLAVCLMLSLTPLTAQAAGATVQPTEWSAVQTAVNGMSDGDTLDLSAMPQNPASAVTITISKNITVTGAYLGNTAAIATCLLNEIYFVLEGTPTVTFKNLAIKNTDATKASVSGNGNVIVDTALINHQGTSAVAAAPPATINVNGDVTVKGNSVEVDSNFVMWNTEIKGTASSANDGVAGAAISAVNVTVEGGKVIGGAGGHSYSTDTSSGGAAILASGNVLVIGSINTFTSDSMDSTHVEGGYGRKNGGDAIVAVGSVTVTGGGIVGGYGVSGTGGSGIVAGGNVKLEGETETISASTWWSCWIKAGQGGTVAGVPIQFTDNNGSSVRTLTADTVGIWGTNRIAPGSAASCTIVMYSNDVARIDGSRIGWYTDIPIFSDGKYVITNPENTWGILSNAGVRPLEPDAPALSGRTTTSITLTAITEAEYSIDDGATWQDSPTFDGLTPNTEYTFVARIKAVAGISNASENSLSSAPITTASDSSYTGGTTTPTIPAAEGEVQVNYSQSGGTVTLTMPDSKLTEIIGKSEDTAVLDLSGIKDATTATLPTTALDAFADAGLDVEIKLPQGTVTLDGAAAASVAAQAGGASISVELGQVPASSLNEAQREAVKDGGTVIDISIHSGTQRISSFDGELTITIPYSGELPAAVWYLNDAGELEKLVCTYDAATGTLSFTLDHLSLYVIGQDTNPFTDVKESDWFYEDVEYVYKNGLMQGTGAATFSPYTAVSRAMAVTVLWRLEGEPEVTDDNLFTDLTQDWHTEAVVWASSTDIVEGYGNGKFGPDDSITREQLATILYRYCQYKGVDVSASADLSNYADAGSISDWALDAMKWANAEGLITGRSTTSLAPRGTATRAELATILRRFCESVIG